MGEEVLALMIVGSGNRLAAKPFEQFVEVFGCRNGDGFGKKLETKSRI